MCKERTGTPAEEHARDYADLKAGQINAAAASAGQFRIDSVEQASLCGYAVDCTDCDRRHTCVKHAINELWLVVHRNRDHKQLLAEAEERAMMAETLIGLLKRQL
ncbi:hypothetical protein LCGC14_2929720 [marine sediment metagenome]|uniref:Uncharacterized protein n=1 Tax=marine sediment metagenome TaxID=412755 RepID=A0A0F8Y864_9ZZZZ